MWHLVYRQVIKKNHAGKISDPPEIRCHWKGCLLNSAAALGHQTVWCVHGALICIQQYLQSFHLCMDMCMCVCDAYTHVCGFFSVWESFVKGRGSPDCMVIMLCYVTGSRTYPKTHGGRMGALWSASSVSQNTWWLISVVLISSIYLKCLYLRHRGLQRDRAWVERLEREIQNVE